jgi:hypothetical protein
VPRTLILASITFVLLLGAATAGAADTLGSLHCNDSLDVSLKKGQPVTVTAVVVGQFSTTKSARLYVDDGTGAINVFGPGTNCAVVGDSVRVSGVVGDFRGLTELTGSDAHPLKIQVLGHASQPPMPLVLNVKQVRETQGSDGCEPNESRLVELDDVLIRNWDGTALGDSATFEGNGNYRLIPSGASGPDPTTWASMRVIQADGCDTTRSVARRPIPVGVPVRVIGVLSQYTPRNSTKGGYQILPREFTDVRAMALIKKK